ncbi:hypothetical protein A2U01_0091813, partial [Trifolium medium]|nr:hypothetical protein [Trifolium medium]
PNSEHGPICQDLEDGPTRRGLTRPRQQDSHLPRAPPSRTHGHSNLSLIPDKRSSLTQDDGHELLIPTST